MDLEGVVMSGTREFKDLTSRDKQRLRLVEVDATDRAFMLIKAVNECAHPIIPQLNHTAVQAAKNPWPFGMEA
jgi:hypothetical protein